MKLYRTAALPRHYVVAAPDGSKFLVPVEPIGPEVWKERKPYQGNYPLEEVPDVIAALYRTYHWEADHAR